MPELPEVEAVCRKLREEALGAEIARAKVFRPGTVHPHSPRSVEKRLRGRTLDAVARRGKNIFVELSGGVSVRVHLRMTGNLRVIPHARPRPAATRVLLELTDGRAIVFEDPRALGVMHLCSPDEAAAIVRKLGPEPLSAEFTAEAFVEAARHSRKPAKLFLMDQGHVAGLGNIYAAEALFRARIHPAKPMNRLRRGKLEALHSVIVTVLTEAVDWAVEAYARPGEFGEAEDFPLCVYDREGEPCFECGRLIRRVPQGGRSTYYCPGCQREFRG